MMLLGRAGGGLKANKSKPGAGVETTESTKINLPAGASGDWMCWLAGSKVFFSFSPHTRSPNQLFKNFNSPAFSTEWKANLHQVPFVVYERPFQIFITFVPELCVCGVDISAIVCVSVPARVITQKYLKGMLSYGSAN